MALILMVAAGVLLAFILLPLLGPIAVCIAAITLIGCGIIYSIGVSMAAMEAAKNAVAKAKTVKQLSFKTKVRSAPAFRYALSAIEEPIDLQGLQRSPVGLWYRYVLADRIRNRSMSDTFRVPNDQNRVHLEVYLQKTVEKGKDPSSIPRAEELCQRILKAHDQLCIEYQPKQNTAAKPK